MLKNIKIKNNTIEMMLYCWQSLSERQKVSDAFFIEVGENDEMQYIYKEDFNKESVRKVLSAICNNELLNNASKAEKRFWNNNMWMLEDLDNLNNMVKPVKTLNLNHLVDGLNKDNPKYETIEVIFVPGHDFEYLIKDNVLVINFFKIMVDYMDPEKVNISGKALEDYVEEKLIELISKE